MRQLLAGNWKMHGLTASLDEIAALIRGLKSARAADLLICPPATLIAQAVRAAQGSVLKIGGQDCHAKASGAFTGDISAEMLRDAGATTVILGHSERRHGHGETDAMVAEKISAAKRAGLKAILCVGETESERNAARALDVVTAQFGASIPDGVAANDLVIAYEPVWAIGTGRTPKMDDIAEMHGAIRRLLEARFGAAGSQVMILYGGSVKPDNAREILRVAHVNGALIGGASLKAADFLTIIAAAVTAP